MFDYNEAHQQREIDLIPHNTIATLQMTVRPGNAGEDGLLQALAGRLCEMLDVEFTVVDGQFAKRKLWERFVLAGTTDGHAKAAEISRGKLRAILESRARHQAGRRRARRRERRAQCKLADFDGMRFIAKIGIEKGKHKGNGDGEYPDRTSCCTVITPDRKDWHAVEQVPPPPQAVRPTAASAPAPAAITKPAWAS